MPLILCEDRKQILAATGHVLVTGGPGSGKTTIALAKAVARVELGLLPGQTVLFLSFSRAAVSKVLQVAEADIPKHVRQQLSIQTFHSFFWEILKGYGYLLGAPKKLRLLLPHDESAMRRGAEGDDIEWTTERARLFREEGLVTFDLFAPKARELLTKSTRIRQLVGLRHPIVVVDEAQDTADDQWQCVQLFGEKLQLLCLADLDQQIYDFRPGVSSERVTQIMASLSPLRVDLRGQNHRSGGSEICVFGNDILLGTPRGAPYKGVSRYAFNPKKELRDKAIRSSIGIVVTRTEKDTGSKPASIAVLATWGRGVGVISRALSGNGTNAHIPHRVMIDEAGVLLSSRIVAFLMEPRKRGDELGDLATVLRLLAAVYQARGSTSSLAQADRLSKSLLQCQQGKTPRANGIADQVLGVLRGLNDHEFSGDSRKDWLQARRCMRDSGCGALEEVAGLAEQLMTLQKGHRIATELTALWQNQGNYAGARGALDLAVAEDQLLSSGDDSRGIHVMTIHKSKGKEFDAVIVFDDSNNSPLIFCKEGAAQPRSRKLLRVGITRARHHVLLLTDLFKPSPLLAEHRL